MHRVWEIPELLIHIITSLPANDIDRSFYISHHFRTVLKSNLQPQLRPLPDCPQSKSSSSSQTLPQNVCDRAKAYIAHEAATPKQLKMEDAYYYWREDARCQVLDTLSPHLHPVFDKYATRLIDGYESLAGGQMSICLQTDMPYHQVYDLLHGKERHDRNGFLALKPPKAVTVFCLGGVSWDLLYTNVRYREYGGVKRFSVRAEREEGVRLGDVMDELKGTLIVDGMSGGLGQDVILVWVFDDNSDEEAWESSAVSSSG